jgi:hypothetical protein
LSEIPEKKEPILVRNMARQRAKKEKRVEFFLFLVIEEMARARLMTASAKVSISFSLPSPVLIRKHR